MKHHNHTQNITNISHTYLKIQSTTQYHKISQNIGIVLIRIYIAKRNNFVLNLNFFLIDTNLHLYILTMQNGYK